MSANNISPDTACLRNCLTRYLDSIPELANITDPADCDSQATIIGLYDQCYPLLEKALWSNGWSRESDFEALLDCYQSLFREQDVLIRQKAEAEGATDERYHFILSIPVADRPPHLRACLESIYRVCRHFGYGGNPSGVYERIKVIVAEDSREAHNIRQHIELIEEYQRKGLQVIHFGLDEQYALLQSIPEDDRKQLGHFLTTQPRDRFYLKGQAANRNLSVLKCLQITEDKNRTLYYFVDSDESFCVNRQTAAGERAVYALNYFRYIDKAFRTTETLLLTGKMVGDPPVSPAVMAANFLDDVIAFFTDLTQTRGDQDCRFHGQPQTQPGTGSSGAAYHDMAGLFGFENKNTPFPYRCPLEGKHDHTACLRGFAQRLAAFFFGEHLTRRTYFSFGNGFSELAPARTIYPGNTIASYAGLKYIIPFGHLRLRMSGPTAGRLIAAEINDRFASINLPHLHRRTTGADLSNAFRPGVERADDEQENIDLSNEFERQFFGDLMLFTTEALVSRTDVSKPFEKHLVMEVMEGKENELLAQYQQKHDAIVEKNRQLEALVFNAGHWWLDDPGLTGALQQVRAFIDNIDHNFGEQSFAWQQIQSGENRATRKQHIAEALMNYRTERTAWDSLFDER